jgi:hypothetical protein
VAEEEGQRYVLEGAEVFVHVTKHERTGESLVHIDVLHPELNDIILPKESTYVGGQKGGFYVGLRPTQIKRAEEFLQGRL